MKDTGYSIILDSKFQDEEENSCFEYLEVLKTKRKPQHSHPELEILLVLDGKGLRIIGDSVEEFEKGDLCLVGPDLYHTWFSQASKNQSIRALVIHFEPELLGRHILNMPVFKSMKDMLTESKYGLLISGKSRDTVAAMMREIGSHHPASSKRFCLLLSILAEIAESKERRMLADHKGAPVYLPLKNKVLEKIHHLLQSNLDTPLSQDSIARAVGMSPASFSRYFKRHTNKTYTNYVNEFRIKLVCRDLVETDKDVSKIAMDTGFNNVSHFNKVFRASKGMTPLEYRKMLSDSIAV